MMPAHNHFLMFGAILPICINFQYESVLNLQNRTRHYFCMNYHVCMYNFATAFSIQLSFCAKDSMVIGSVCGLPVCQYQKKES